MNPGPTGEFPGGKICSEDEGAENIGIGIDYKNKVIVFDFGVPINWFAMSAEEAEKFIDIIKGKIALMRIFNGSNQI